MTPNDFVAKAKFFQCAIDNDSPNYKVVGMARSLKNHPLFKTLKGAQKRAVEGVLEKDRINKPLNDKVNGMGIVQAISKMHKGPKVGEKPQKKK